MSKMKTKKNGPGDKVHTIIDKNCTLKQIKNNKLLRKTQLDKVTCAKMRKELKTQNVPESQTATTASSVTQTYKGKKSPVNPAKLNQKQIALAKKNYVSSSNKKEYLQSRPKIERDALKSIGIK